MSSLLFNHNKGTWRNVILENLHPSLPEDVRLASEVKGNPRTSPTLSKESRPYKLKQVLRSEFDYNDHLVSIVWKSVVVVEELKHHLYFIPLKLKPEFSEWNHLSGHFLLSRRWKSSESSPTKLHLRHISQILTSLFVEILKIFSIPNIALAWIFRFSSASPSDFRKHPEMSAWLTASPLQELVIPTFRISSPIFALAFSFPIALEPWNIAEWLLVYFHVSWGKKRQSYASSKLALTGRIG